MSNPSRNAYRYYQPKPSSGFMSRAQVSEEFGFSVSFLNQLPPDELPCYMRGRKAFYIREEVIAWMKAGRVQGGSREPVQAVRLSRGRPRKPALSSAAR